MPTLMEVIEHAHQVAQAAGQLVEFPDDQRVAVLGGVGQLVEK